MRILPYGWRICPNMTADGRFETGRRGEAAASERYLRDGYEILERNWRWRRTGEIDLVAYHRARGILVICEVKTRRAEPLARPCEAVNFKKRRRLRTLAQIYLLQSGFQNTADVRFDVAEAILEDDGEITLHLIEDAF